LAVLVSYLPFAEPQRTIDHYYPWESITVVCPRSELVNLVLGGASIHRTAVSAVMWKVRWGLPLAAPGSSLLILGTATRQIVRRSIPLPINRHRTDESSLDALYSSAQECIEGSEFRDEGLREYSIPESYWITTVHPVRNANFSRMPLMIRLSIGRKSRMARRLENASLYAFPVISPAGTR